MDFALKPIALAPIIAVTQLAGVAYAAAPKASAAPIVQRGPAASWGPGLSTAGEYGMVYEGTTYTPVVVDVSRHLDAARKAFDAKDSKKAAAEMRAAAEALKLQTARAGREDRALVAEDRALLAADMKFAQGTRDIIKRVNASALKVGAAAAAIDRGKIKTKADLDRAIDKAARADMDRRWLLTDVTTWYPVSGEPQRHFTNAAAAYAKKDYKSAATDIRKATGYLRIEAGRAAGDAKQELDSSVVQLDTLAASVENGAVTDEQSLDTAFAKADHALALEHRSKAAESWPRKAYDEAGYELTAASQELERAAALDRCGSAGGRASDGGRYQSPGRQARLGRHLDARRGHQGLRIASQQHQCTGSENRRRQEGIAVRRRYLTPVLSTHQILNTLKGLTS